MDSSGASRAVAMATRPVAPAPGLSRPPRACRVDSGLAAPALSLSRRHQTCRVRVAPTYRVDLQASPSPQRTIMR